MGYLQQIPLINTNSWILPVSKKHLKKTPLMSEEEKAETNSKKQDKKNTSLRLDKSTLKALKILAIEEDISVQKLIERLINEYINKSK